MGKQQNTLCILKIEATPSNIFLPDFLVANWRLEWRDNFITAVSRRRHSEGDSLRYFEWLEDSRNLGLIVDICTMITDCMLSTRMSFRVYPVDAKMGSNFSSHTSSLPEVLSQLKRLKPILTGSEGEVFPHRFDPSDGPTRFADEHLELIQELFSQLALLGSNTSSVYHKKNLKLIGYWRRGFDLRQFGYSEEAYLAYFKILEHFSKRGQGESFGERVLHAVGSTSRDPEYISALNRFQDYRNNFDIAHANVSRVLSKRNPGLYFRHTNYNWSLHDDIAEVSRYLLLSYLGFKSLELVNHGGLLLLSISKEERKS